MFARHVVVRLKAKAAPEFTRLIETAVIPMLRKQKGFLDEIVFISPDLTEAVGNSFWARRMEAYSRGQEVIRSLRQSWRERRRCRTNVSNSTSTRSRLAMQHKARRSGGRGSPLSTIHLFRLSSFRASL